uniref:Uncharacterized protein n=1 Tax=Arundo donax TaxID=35708 RepID=A0A0A9ECP7_ARUDO
MQPGTSGGVRVYLPAMVASVPPTECGQVNGVLSTAD